MKTYDEIKAALQAVDALVERWKSEITTVPSSQDIFVPPDPVVFQSVLDRAAAGSTIQLTPGFTYTPSSIWGFICPPRPGGVENPIRITSQGFVSGPAGFAGLVRPVDADRMATIQGSGEVGLHVMNGTVGGPPAGGVIFEGVAFLPNPNAKGVMLKLGWDSERDPTLVARNVKVRQCALLGDIATGQKRGIELNADDVEISQSWIDECWRTATETQAIGSWRGGRRVHIHHNYLSGGAETIMVGGSALPVGELSPSDWIVEDNVMHKPLRWRDEALADVTKRRGAKNLFELKFGQRFIVRRNLMVNNWIEGQGGDGVLFTFTTNGTSRVAPGLRDIVFEDNVILNSEGGVQLSGYSYQSTSYNVNKLLNLRVINNLFLLGKGRPITLSNVKGRHDILFKNNSFRQTATPPSMAALSYGKAWEGDPSAPVLVNGGPMQGFSLVDNVFSRWGTYGVTAPDGIHQARGLTQFVTEGQISGNHIGGVTSEGLANLSKLTAGGSPNLGMSSADLEEAMALDNLTQLSAGAYLSRLMPVLALRSLLPEP